MMDRLFPRAVDNHYPGHPIALWVLVPITLLALPRSRIPRFQLKRRKIS